MMATGFESQRRSSFLICGSIKFILSWRALDSSSNNPKRETAVLREMMITGAAYCDVVKDFFFFVFNRRREKSRKLWIRATPPRTSRRNKKNVIRWSRARKFDSNEPCIVITIDIIYVLRAIQKKKKKGKRRISAVGSLLAMEIVSGA